MLPLPLSGAAAARPGAELRRGRGARRAARDRGNDPGDRGEHPYILDVRNPEEWQIARLDGAHLIPLSELPQRVGELDPSQEIILHCKSGKRSQRALEFLREQAGFRKLKNLKGGIDAWA